MELTSKQASQPVATRPEGGTARRRRLAILSSHPIQYFTPWFRSLTNHFDLEVLYAHRQNPAGQAAAGFGVNFEWDVPLLEGYQFRWLRNVSRRPGLQTFAGCDTPEIFDLVRERAYDAVLVLGWNRKTFIQGIRACWKNKVPVICRGDSQLGRGRSRLMMALKYLLYRWFLPRFNAHLHVGQRNRAYLRHYGVPESRLFFAPHFVDNEFFATRAEEARRSGLNRALREELGIPSDAFVALFVGKLLPKKRAADFIAASLHVTERQNNYHALVVGDGRLRLQLEVLAEPQKGRIHFAGFRNQSEMPVCYAAANTLVLPGTETWGLVVNEAMACGVPAVVSDAVGCAPDLIEVGMTGSTFPLGDVPGLARRIGEWIDMPELSRREVSKSLLAKTRVYSMRKATEGLQTAVDALISRQRLS